MTATKPTGSQTLEGYAAQLAGYPLAETPRGGMENGFAGVTLGGSKPATAQAPEGEQNPFAGMGPILENADPDVFKLTDGLVLRQELLAKNHLAQDNYYTCLVSGYPWADLVHDTTRDVYTFNPLYGGSGLTIQAVPNKNLDLVNKAASTVLSDFPEAEAEPLDDSEEAEAAVDMANRFLAQNASEQGTNDAVLFDDRVKRALVTASSYLEAWTDPTGGGYVPLEIKAHPEAVSPDDPLVGPDGQPTTEYVLRYVTADNQFTTDASQAAPQWQPKIMASCWERAHIRVFPEHLPVHLAEKVIILGYCTLGEGKRRWKSIGQMSPEDLSALCDWQPQRYPSLLPPFQRARWKLTDGREKEKSGSSDERIMFYYHIYQRATPDYRKGADVVVTGAMKGFVIDRKLLATDVEVPKAQGRTTETRCREIPVVQITPRADPNGRDPSGLSFLEQFVGATQNNALLASGYWEGVDRTLHTPYAIPMTSPIEGWQVKDARASEDFLIITRMEDKPTQLPPPVMPTGFFEMFSLSDEAINSIANQERAAQGAENSKERSGKALQIAINRNNIANTPMQVSTNNSVARWNRIKIEIAMSDYTTPQLIGYVGDDGSYKEDEFTGVDFALVGKVSIKAGTGTMMPPDQKVQYLSNLRAGQLIDDGEAKEAARPAFAKQLGLPPSSHEQYVERCIDGWVKGPPASPTDVPGEPSQWVVAYQAWLTAQQAFEAAQAQYQAQTQQRQQAMQNQAIVNAGPAQPLGPEQQNETANVQYASASLALTMNPLGPEPVAPQAPQTPKPWTPFNQRPNDTEPGLLAIWLYKLSKTMSSAKYDQFGPEWQDVLNRWYTTLRQLAAMGNAVPTPGAAPSAQPPKSPSPTGASQPKPAAPAQGQHPQPAQQPGAVAA